MYLSNTEKQYPIGALIKNIHTGKTGTIKQHGCTNSTIDGFTVMLVTNEGNIWESCYVELVPVKQVSITAINKTHQSYVNKAYKHLRKYHELVNLVDDCANDKQLLRLEDKQATQFDLYQDALYMLPIREQTNFAKQHKIIHGYT